MAKEEMLEMEGVVQEVLPNTQFRVELTNGASVLIVDARYSVAGVEIESYAKAHGVPVIDYDWLTLGGTHNYYVKFVIFLNPLFQTSTLIYLIVHSFFSVSQTALPSQVICHFTNPGAISSREVQVLVRMET